MTPKHIPRPPLDYCPHYLSLLQDDGSLLVDVHRESQLVLVRPRSFEAVPVPPTGVRPLTPVARARRAGAPTVTNPTATAVTDRLLDRMVALLALPANCLTEDMRALLRSHVHCQYLRSLLPVRPVLLLSGPPGSGKSTIARTPGLLLFGPAFEIAGIPDSTKELKVVLVNNPYVPLDNAESLPPGFVDVLCQAATGVEFTVRRLYTEGGSARLRPDVFLALTAVSMGWVRGDLLDRSLTLWVQGPQAGSRIPDLQWRQEVDRARPDFFVEMLYCLQRALPLLACTPAPQCPDRLADFLRIGQVLAEAAGGTAEGQRFVRGYTAVRASRMRALAESDVLVGGLLEYLARGPAIHTACDWLSNAAMEAGATNRPINVHDAARWAGAEFKRLKARTQGVVGWRTLPRRHGLPVHWEGWLL